MTQVGGTVISQSRRVVIIGGETYHFPKGMRGHDVTITNNKVYIDGFELVGGKWKRTLKALWHRLF